MLRILPLLYASLVVFIPLGIPLAESASFVQIEPDVRDRVVPAAVEIGIRVKVTEDGVPFEDAVPIGSGTVISPHGLILTNWHVVDLAAHREQLDSWEARAARDGTALTLDLVDDGFLILGSATGDAPEPLYVAELVAEDHALDFAALQITRDAQGRTLEPTSLDLAYVPLGNSSSVRQGDPIHIFSYPVAGGGTLQYTAGVVSGFSLEEGIDDRAWITTDATISGGSSGGTAVDSQGHLIGVPTQGSQLDCRPGDTNRDGTVDVTDVGCIPVGGSIGQLRPIALALPVLASAGLTAGTIETEAPAVAVAPTPVPAAAPVDTAPTDPSAATSYVFAEDYCRTGPVHQPGTRIVLPREVWAEEVPGPSASAITRALFYQVILPEDANKSRIPLGTVVQISGSFVEDGICDLWPVRYRTEDGVEKEALIDEWDLSPDFPNQIPPPPRERQAITSDSEEFCQFNPDYSKGTVVVMPQETRSFSHFRGYGFQPGVRLPAGTEPEIVGPPIETGVCDMWPVRFVIPGSDPPLALIGEYIHESDLHPVGN